MRSTVLSAAKRTLSRILIAAALLQHVVFVIPAAEAAQQGGMTVSPMVVGGVDGYHFVSLKSDGTVWTWGMNSDGQIGDNTTGGFKSAPTKVHGASNIGFLTGVKSVAAGSFHSVALKTDGTVWTWGRGNEGEMGDGTTSDSNVPVQVTSLTDVIAIAAGGYHTIALKADGTVWGWGGNWAGQLGDNTQTQRTTPVQMHGVGNVGFLTGIKMIATGAYHSLALKNDGTMYATGWNDQGSLGDGTTTERDVPIQVDNTDLNSDVKFIAGGLETSFAILSDGTAWAWGYNDYGQLGDNTNVDKSVPTQMHGIGNVGFLTGVVGIGGGEYFSAALLDDGTIAATGENNSGQFGDGTTTASLYPMASGSGTNNVKVAAVAGYNVAALRTDGSIKTWGFSIDGELGDGATPAPPYYTENPVTAGINLYAAPGAIAAAAGHHSMILKNDGSVWAWGRNDYGQLGDGTTVERHYPTQVHGAGNSGYLTNVIDIQAGFYHSIALKADGTVWAWGDNTSGDVGDGTTFARHYPIQVSGVSGVTAVAAGDFHSVALKSDGTVWTWGMGSDGELGNGGNTDSTSPVQVSGLANVIAVAAHGRFTMALKTDGTVWTWGTNAVGELGDGNSPVDSNVPVQVSGLTGVSAIESGGFHGLAIKSNGTLWAWGSGPSGQLGNGANTDSDVPVQVSSLSTVVGLGGGYDHNTALLADGTLWAWGYGGDGELGNGANSDSNVPVQVDDTNLGTDVKTLAVGTGGQSIVVKYDGSVWTWGANWYGQLGDGTTTDSNVPIQVLFGITPPPTPNTVNNWVSLSREAVNATASATIHFVLNDTLSSQLTMTFDPAFTGMDVSGASAVTPAAPGCMSNFVATGPNTFTADKSSCTGDVTISGVTVVNPPTPGGYLVSWINDDDGYAMVAIVDSDQITVNASVDPSITFDLNTGTTNAPVSAPYSVALGALTTGAVSHSDNSGVNSVWANLDTNATGGAVVTVLSQNAALKSLSVGTDTIPNSGAAMAAGTANYGLCVNTVTPPTQAAGTFQASAPYNAGTCDPAGSTNDVQALSTVTPTSILDSNANPVTTGSAEILVNAAISTATVAHSDYADVLTFVATGTF